MDKQIKTKPKKLKFKNREYTQEMIDAEIAGTNQRPKKDTLVYRDNLTKEERCPMWNLKELWENKNK